MCLSLLQDEGRQHLDVRGHVESVCAERALGGGEARYGGEDVVEEELPVVLVLAEQVRHQLQGRQLQ